MNPKLFWLITAILLASIHPAKAQQQGKIARIGYVSGTGSTSNPGPYVEALRHGLRDLGYIEGKNFVIEFRGAEGHVERVPGLVGELVQLHVDILVALYPGAVRAAKEATNTIPIIMITGVDPVESGWVYSLARPGGNLTGITTLAQELNGKRLELLTEIIPGLSHVSVLRYPAERSAAIAFKEYQAAAGLYKVQLHSLDVRVPNPDLEEAFQTATKQRAQVLITVTTAALFVQRKRIADLAIKTRLPSLYQGSDWVASGGLMSYSTDEIALYRRAATYIDKILKGAKPADIPVEQPTKFELVINLKTAKQIGLTISPNVLARADRVIR